jgi:hypothetical protein
VGVEGYDMLIARYEWRACRSATACLEGEALDRTIEAPKLSVNDIAQLAASHCGGAPG